jgi:hypothetical protein
VECSLREDGVCRHPGLTGPVSSGGEPGLLKADKGIQLHDLLDERFVVFCLFVCLFVL